MACSNLESISYGGTMSKWHSLTDGDCDMFSGGKTVIVKCSDGEIECSGTMKTQNSVYD